MEQPLYECMRCEARWSEPKSGPTGCPTCLHVYVRWMNYESMFNREKSSGEASQR